MGRGDFWTQIQLGILQKSLRASTAIKGKIYSYQKTRRALWSLKINYSVLGKLLVACDVEPSGSEFLRR